MFYVFKEHKDDKLNMTVEELCLLFLAAGVALVHEEKQTLEQQICAKKLLDCTLTTWFEENETSREIIKDSRKSYEKSAKMAQAFATLKKELIDEHMQRKLEELVEMLKDR